MIIEDIKMSQFKTVGSLIKYLQTLDSKMPIEVENIDKTGDIEHISGLIAGTDFIFKDDEMVESLVIYGSPFHNV